MPRKKKPLNPEEMSDRDILKLVFPERVIRRIEEELERDSPAPERENWQDSPNDQSL